MTSQFKSADSRKENLLRIIMSGLFFHHKADGQRMTNEYFVKYNTHHVTEYGRLRMCTPQYTGVLEYKSLEFMWEKGHLVLPNDPLFNEGVDLVTMLRDIAADYSKIEFFLSMFLNKVRSIEDFNEVIPVDMLVNAIRAAKIGNSNFNIKKTVQSIISGRQSFRPTSQHSYEIFLNDNKELLDILGQYCVESLLLT